MAPSETRIKTLQKAASAFSKKKSLSSVLSEICFKFLFLFVVSSKYLKKKKKKKKKTERKRKGMNVCRERESERVKNLKIKLDKECKYF